ncbi:MAG: c-type cytochrome [Verrucomicrobiales bacterium]|nr:c-type cytochrome [Verrucomicrobiales bacterium]
MVAPANAVSGKLPSSAPTPARDAAKTFRVLDGFRMDLLAAEPLVTSPVAMAYDENGGAYVCEMRDYPYTDKAHHQRNQENPTDSAIGTVRLLQDSDGDGVFDQSTVFADGLSWPTGVACSKGGVFVAATPDIWYLKDTDGDGKADVRRKVFTGFRKLNVQSVMNNLVWGLDNHIYGAGSSNGGQIRPRDKPEAKPLVMTRNDFRFNPVTEQFEVLSGGARFGGSFDDWGHRFLCDIRNPAQHIVLPQRYLARNPYLAARSPLHDMAESGDQLPVYRISPPEPWRVLRAKRWAGERDIVMPRSELVGAGVVTSSSGIITYRGAAYPEKYRDNVFVCECAGNLFYRLQLTSDGPTFEATRVDGQAEMVASTDNWFRPVNFVNAPDGTLHVTDMYRENIEHPWSIPDDIHAAVDLESGRDMGRLWRLTPPNFAPRKAPRLGHATTVELVLTLENPNSWWRETAQRLLFERQDQSAVPALRKLVKRGRTPQARLHALWALAGLNSLADGDVLAGLKDQSAGVRENVVKLAEPRVSFVAGSSRGEEAQTSPIPSVSVPLTQRERENRSQSLGNSGRSKLSNHRVRVLPLPKGEGRGEGNGNVLTQMLRLAFDSDARVRFQLAFTLGEITEPRSADALAAIAKRDAADPWIRTAILSSVANTSDQLLTRLLADPGFVASSAATELIRELAQIVGVRGQTPEMQRMLASVGVRSPLPLGGEGQGEGVLRQVVFGIGEGLKRSGKSLRGVEWDRETSRAIDRLLSQAAQTATNPQEPIDTRAVAIRFLTFDNFESVNAALASLLEAKEPQEIQRAAAAAIGSFTPPETAPILLGHWRDGSPALRSEIVLAMLGGRSRLLPLLEAIRDGVIPANQVPFPRRAVLLRSTDEQVKELATKLFSDAAPRSRKEVVAKYQAALSMKGDARRGQKVFETACATCHRAGDLGKDVGPNLATIRQWNPDQVLGNILDPNREVAPNFVGYTVETRDGRTLDGIIADESAASLTLKRAEGVTETVLRRDIATISGSGLSLMPEGLEANITVEQMVDLIAFLLP